MATDGITIRALTKEFNEKLTGGRVQKIYQINDHLILINIYNNKNNYKLLISSNPQNARIHLTNQEYKNPTKAPQFSMILRKHIQNSIIEKIEQIGLDRSVEFTFLSKDELGFNATKKLIIDIMGKHSNIVLTNEENKVIESIKRISHEMSSVRAVYPGTIFINLKDDKIDITTNDKNLLDINIPENFSIKKIFYMTYTGFGPQIAEEIAYKSNLDSKRTLSSLSNEEITILNDNFIEFKNEILSNNFEPHIFYNKDKVNDFYCMNLTYKGTNSKNYKSISEALDIYYKENVNDNSLNQAKSNLSKSIIQIINKLENKLTNLRFDYEKSKEYEKYRIEGELLSGVAFNITKGQTSVIVENYYDNTKSEIKLNPTKSPWENIELKYKTSKKLHKSFNLLSESIPNLINDIQYLVNINNQLKNADTIEEINEIKEEMYQEGYIKKQKSKHNDKSNKSSNPYKFITKNNNIIYVGKNNKQNEYLTLREANPDDYFFHIKDLPGAHVILKNNQKITEDDIIQAAFLAAKYSKNNNDRYIDVDYTLKKNVNKAKGSKPGMVYYTDFKTIRIDLEYNTEF
ncbi:fibronectin/fibrinogen-binding protein [Helcococcus ovis]|uniref:Rqc2 family fibronectin-binding protein n=1 Tax=Helcococcus ovis TaxID=72026 RepID=UPI00106FB221|nr:NFACT RNA binding domain-containing protein [Helcococcus ovis]TFF67968.1 fibronectin/fibrinogen-binding protein [Helcococcus ovis]WNZ01923.1 NFACT RNA binding domain-containing protein [Helcococcus ovis]